MRARLPERRLPLIRLVPPDVDETPTLPPPRVRHHVTRINPELREPPHQLRRVEGLTRIRPQNLQNPPRLASAPTAPGIEVLLSIRDESPPTHLHRPHAFKRVDIKMVRPRMRHPPTPTTVKPLMLVHRLRRPQHQSTQPAQEQRVPSLLQRKPRNPRHLPSTPRHPITQRSKHTNPRRLIPQTRSEKTTQIRKINDTHKHV